MTVLNILALVDASLIQGMCGRLHQANYMTKERLDTSERLANNSNCVSEMQYSVTSTKLSKWHTKVAIINSIEGMRSKIKKMFSKTCRILRVWKVGKKKPHLNGSVFSFL